MSQLLFNNKFIDNRIYFHEIIDEYLNIEKKIDQSKNKNDIYKK